MEIRGGAGALGSHSCYVLRSGRGEVHKDSTFCGINSKELLWQVQWSEHNTWAGGLIGVLETPWPHPLSWHSLSCRKMADSGSSSVGLSFLTCRIALVKSRCFPTLQFLVWGYSQTEAVACSSLGPHCRCTGQGVGSPGWLFSCLPLLSGISLQAVGAALSTEAWAQVPPVISPGDLRAASVTHG